MARILVIDDERSIRLTLGAFLRKQGHDVETADAAESGLAAFERSAFDVVLTDIVLPRASGIHVLEAVRERAPNLPVILMTGQPTLDTAAAAVRSRAFDYLRKPVRRDVLLVAVTAAAAAKARDDELERLRVENQRYQDELARLVEDRTKELRESERRNRVLLEAVPDILFQLDRDGVFKAYSAPSPEALALLPDSFMGKSVQETMPAPFAESVMGCIRSVLADGTLQVLEYQLPVPLPDGELRSFEARFTPCSSDEVLAIVRDVTERQRARDALRRRSELEALITEMATDVVSLAPDRLDGGLNRGLARIAEFVGADRSYVFQFGDDGRTASNTHEWCAPGVEPQIANLQDVPIAEELPWFFERINARSDFVVPRVSELPPEASGERAHFEPQGIQSLVVVPMVCQDRVTGFMGFDAVNDERDWSEDVVMLLRNVAAASAGALVRAREEKSLMAAREQWEEIFQAIGQPALILDGDHHVINANQAALQVAGCSLAEMQDCLCHGVFCAVDAPPESCPMRTFRSSGTADPVSMEATAFGRQFLISCTPVFDSGGALGRVIHIATDITEQKRTEEALRQSEDRFRVLAEIAPAGIYLTDLGGRCLYANPRWCEMAGLQPEEALGHGWSAGLHPEDRDWVSSRWQRMVESEGRWGTEYRFRTAAGKVTWVYGLATPQRDAAGQLVGYVGINLDISERKRAEEALRASEQKYRALFQTSRDAIMTLAPPSWRFTSGNPATVRVFGVSDEADFVSRAPWEYSPELQPDGRSSKEKALEMIETAMRVGFHFFEWRHQRWGGGEFPAAVLLTRVESDAGDFLQATVRDETERIALEAQLRQSQKLESIGTLAGGVAHEVNNPINGIMNYAQLIKDGLGERDSELTEFAGEIIHETDRIAALVRNLLQFSRSDSQKHAPVRVCDVVSATSSLIRTVLRHDQVILEVDVPPDLPPMQCRSQQIQQVIMNLLTNARDALNARYPGYDANKIIRLTARCHARGGGQWVRITVEDQGEGIAPDVADRIFDPFFTTKGRSEGTGLGLSISHGIVRDHNGHIFVESEPGAWTRFHVDLPVAGD